MGMIVNCPGGHTLSIKDKYAGKSGKCPRCGVKIRVPRAAPINASFVESLLPKTDVLNEGQHVLDDVPTGQSGVSLLGPISAMSQSANRPMEILLIEDSRSDAELAMQALRNGNVKCQITHITNGSDAIQLLLQQGRYSSAARPDLILLDLNLPGIDGRAVLRTIATDFVLKTIPVVVMTASTEHEDRIRSEALNVAGYMVKPVDVEKFVVLVRQLMDYWDSDVILPAASMSDTDSDEAERRQHNRLEDIGSTASPGTL